MNYIDTNIFTDIELCESEESVYPLLRAFATKRMMEMPLHYGEYLIPHCEEVETEYS